VKVGYSWAVEGEAYRYLVGRSKRRRKKLEQAIEMLAARPFQAPLFSGKSDDGSQLDIIETDGHLITYHVEHSVRRVRITEISPLS
jgi:hypothetical protein